MSKIQSILKVIQTWFRRCNYREGCTVSRFIAFDIKREIVIVSTARIAEGIITGRVRTTNILYVRHGLVEPSDFEPAKELHVSEMWKWSGQGWGGLPDGTSIVDQFRDPNRNAD